MDIGKDNWYQDCGNTTQDQYNSHWWLTTLGSNVGVEHVHHLQKVLEQHYEIKFNLSGQLYIGITILWDYHQQQVHLTIPSYLKKALKLFQHKAYKRLNAPYPMTAIKYGAKQQYAQQESSAPPLE